MEEPGQQLRTLGQQGTNTPDFLGAKSSTDAQIQQRILVLVALGVPGVLAVQLAQGLLPSRSPQVCQQGRGLPCFPA
jgi:hypothetical protein